MKPIYLATCYFQPNYGSILQAFATQEFFDSNNIPNMTINISGISDIIKRRKISYFRRNIFNKDIVIDKLSFIKLVLNMKLNRSLGDHIQKRNLLFNEFSQTKFHLTRIFTTFPELSETCERNTDAVIVGSDQLWLPTNIEADYYTLNFVPDNIKKISYSTSFGVSSLPSLHRKKATCFLNRFDYLSVREQSGQSLVEKFIGKTPVLVCDPVILLTVEQWLELIKDKSKPNDKYIFCYLLGKEKKHYQWAKALSNTTGLKIIGLTNLDTYLKVADELVDIPMYDATPFDFVNLIKNAEYVCTDSFHATVFSLMFHQRVFTFRRFVDNNLMSTNGRLESLYRLLGKEDAFISLNKPIQEALKSTINYTLVDKIFEDLRNSSIQYLAEALDVELH